MSNFKYWKKIDKFAMIVNKEINLYNVNQIYQRTCFSKSFIKSFIGLFKSSFNIMNPSNTKTIFYIYIFLTVK